VEAELAGLGVGELLLAAVRSHATVRRTAVLIG
jgi:hypothetical protein